MNDLREQLIRVLDWEEAHVGFDKAVDGVPAEQRGARAAGFEHTLWQLLEHMRLAQKDLLAFCIEPKYVHTMKWPDDYWPKPAPAGRAWEESVADFKADREKVKSLVRDTEDLAKSVPTGNKSQTYLRSILLIIDHNSYHLGQFVAVRKALGIWH